MKIIIAIYSILIIQSIIFSKRHREHTKKHDSKSKIAHKHPSKTNFRKTMGMDSLKDDGIPKTYPFLGKKFKIPIKNYSDTILVPYVEDSSSRTAWGTTTEPTPVIVQDPFRKIV